LALTADLSWCQSGTWSAPGTSNSPGPRRQYGSIFDGTNQVYYLFEGFDGDNYGRYVLFNDVWALSVSGAPEWNEILISGSLPGQRHSPQWGYDEARNRVLMFGGYGSHYPDGPYAYLNDVWQLDLDGTPQWTEITPTGTAPSGRLAGNAVFDPLRQRFVGFGGTVGVPTDTWVLNLQGIDQGSWESLPTQGESPSGRYGATSVYDVKRDRMLIFGGSIGDSYFGATNDVWELDLQGDPTWHQVVTAGTSPQARRSGTAIYDPLRDRMIIYGGAVATESTDTFMADTWALDFTVDPPTWSQLSPDGAIPVQRDCSAAAYDPIHDRMIQYGGWAGDYMLSDTQFLDWGGSSVDASMSATSSATPTSAHVVWDVQSATGSHAAVYRKAPGSDWTALGVGEIDATSRLVYDDPTVQPGATYSYMMVVGSQRGETFGGQTDVVVPVTIGVPGGLSAKFALGPVAPSPVAGKASVSFTLASGAPASLDLFDAAGRTWLHRDVGALGAGPHHIDLATAGSIPPGVYFLRLRQAERVALSRLAVVGSR